MNDFKSLGGTAQGPSAVSSAKTFGAKLSVHPENDVVIKSMIKIKDIYIYTYTYIHNKKHLDGVQKSEPQQWNCVRMIETQEPAGVVDFPYLVIHAYLPLSIYLCIYLSIYLSVYPSIYTILYHTIRYHTTPHHTIPYHTILYYIILYYILLYYIYTILYYAIYIILYFTIPYYTICVCVCIYTYTYLLVPSIFVI